MFQVVTDTTISSSLGRWYWPVLSRYLFDVYGYSIWYHYICSGYWYKYVLQPEQAECASAQSIFLDIYGYSMWLLVQLDPAG